MPAIFLDTYAMFELIKGNPHYVPYRSNFHYVTTTFQLLELYYSLRRDGHPEETAKHYFLRFSDFRVPVEGAVLMEAAEFKLQQKKRNLSYANSVGYAVARHFSIPFLTGDRQFEHMENVRFVQ